MGVTTFTEEYATPVAAARIFKATIVEAHKIIPKLMPQSIKSIEFIKGDGGAGTIKKTTFAEGAHLKSLTNKIDALDTQALTCKYTLTEGDILDDKLQSICYNVKFEPSGTGCIIKTTTEYHTKGDEKIKEEDLKAGKASSVVGLTKAVEDYLIANPSVCA